jgi:hypothetical protein
MACATISCGPDSSGHELFLVHFLYSATQSNPSAKVHPSERNLELHGGQPTTSDFPLIKTMSPSAAGPKWIPNMESCGLGATPIQDLPQRFVDHDVGLIGLFCIRKKISA